MIEILLEDGPLLAVNKPAGLITLGVPTGVPTLVDEVKAYLKTTYEKPGNVYLGVPHRLDRPVSGVMVFARNSKCAARLAEMFRNRSVRKVYVAVLEQVPPEPAGELRDWLLKHPEAAQVSVVPAETPQAREAILHYRTLHQFAPDAAHFPNAAVVEIELLTGRMHQIRAQFGNRGCPVLGDVQYGGSGVWPAPRSSDPRTQPIALHAREITLPHPIRYEQVTIVAPWPADWPWAPPCPLPASSLPLDASAEP